jgi:hypothetical protein
MHIRNGLEQELFSLHEFPYIFAYLEYLYNLSVDQRNLMLAGIIEDAAENIFETPKLLKKRKKLDKIQKLYFDEYIYFQGMALFSKQVLLLTYRAMSEMMRGLLKTGVVKNYFTEEYEEEAAYFKRFKEFHNLPYPSYMDYKKYREDSKGLEDKSVLV